TVRDIVTNESVKQETLRTFKPSYLNYSKEPGKLVIPTQTREYRGIACKVVPENSLEASLYQQASKSVVRLQMRNDEGRTFGGTGFVISRDGKLATALHVVEGSHRTLATMQDGTVYHAELIGHDFDNDLAVLQLRSPRKDFEPLKLST